MSSKSKKIVNTDSVLHKSESSNSFPWPEWSDFELNTEPWDYPKSGEFSDPQQIVMPRSLQPTEWKRFRELPFVTSPIIYEQISDYPDFIMNNRHLLHSEFIRCFISTLINIQYYGRNGLEVENPTSNFSWNMGDQCWQGWFHVYSLNKAGKGVSHRPVVNPNGRYIVRIFHMGYWRKILVDDSMPVDKRGRPLLPRTANSNELWPLILAKAMLKIVALSWTNQREIVDCSLIACLTGWIGLSLNVSHLSPRDQWEFLIKYAKHFEWPQEEKMEQDKFDGNEKLGKSRKEKTKVTKLEVPEEPQPTVLFLSLEDMKDADAKEIPGMTPCWNHQIYVELARDVPLDPTQVKPPLAKWKIHRWLDWVISRGLADASEYFVPIRHLLIVSPLRQCSVDLSYAYDDLEEFGEEDSSETTLGSREKKSIKPRSTTIVGSKGKVEGMEMPDISLWGDFNKLSLYLRQVHLFYRQKFFKYTVEVSNSIKNLVTNDGNKGKIDSSIKEGKKSARKTSGPVQTLEKIYEYQDKVWQSRNEPLYLFVESVDEKFFLINFSTIQNTYDDQNLKNASLIVERHNWFKRIIENKSVARLKTQSTKSMVFQLEPGRHLLRIFINYETSYHAIVLSDTPFKIGNRSKMHELMTKESDRVNEVARKLNNGVKKAFESFGTKSYMNDLKFFYHSYMPDSFSKLYNKKDRRVLKSIHGWFIEDFFYLIEKHFSSVDLPTIKRAMRIFFLDPSIGYKTETPDSSSNDNEIEDNWENGEDDWLPNRNAMIIQSFFRTAMIKSYKEIHNTSHKEHKWVKEALGRVIELFNDESHESLANSLLRAIVKHDKSLETIYPWAKDLDHVIQIQEVFGRVMSFTTDQWFPIVRIVVNTEPFENVFASIDLIVNLANYKVRVFENNSKREMFRVVNNVTPNHYRYRKNGYTIFAYGWSDSQKFQELDWSLHLTTVKGEPSFRWNDQMEVIPAKIEIRPLFVKEISGIYVPNKKNCIFKIIVKVRKKCLVSVRSRTSYKKVLTELRVARENGPVLSEMEGGAILILPFVFLEFDVPTGPEIDDAQETEEKMRKPTKSSSRKNGGSSSHRSGNVSRRETIDREVFDNFTCYSIEAVVREDSWPLTEAEWTVALEAKTRKSENISRVRKSSINVRKNERSRNLMKKSLELGKTLEEPYWSVQIVTDTENELEIFEDTSREDKIAELRRIWKTEELGRSERGRKLRDKFVEANSLISALSAIDLNEKMRSSEEDEEMNEIFDTDSMEILPLEKRTLEPPASLGKYLPKLDLTIYMVHEDEEEDRWVKSDYDEETLRNQRAMNVLDFEHLQANFLDESSELMERQNEKYRRITQRYLDNRDNCKRDIDEAYEIRQAFVDSTKNTVKSVKSKDSIKQKKK